MDSSQFANLSPENLSKIQKVLKIIIDLLELKGVNRLKSLKIPLDTLAQQGMNYEEGIAVVDKINSMIDAFDVLGEEFKQKLQFSWSTETELERVRDEMKLFRVSEEDLNNYLILRVKTLDAKDKLEKILTLIRSYASQPVVFPAGETILYQNHVLFFKLGDGTFDSIDFNSAPILRKVFECFWELRKRSTKISFVPTEVINIHEELFKGKIERHYLAIQVSNLKRTKLKSKPHLKERFQIGFDRNSKTWIFILQ